MIIGELVKNLLKELNFNDTVFLDFNHVYTHYCLPDYFISYDNGNIIYNWRRENTPRNLKEKSIIIRQVSRTFNILTTLRLVEYAIKKSPEIELKQKSIVYKKNFCDWTINTIDTSEIKKHLDEPISNILSKVLMDKIIRPENENNDTIYSRLTYFYWDNKFNIYYLTDNRVEKSIIGLDNIYDFKRINNSSALVFDTDSSFYYINYNKSFISKKHLISNMTHFYRPVYIEFSDENNIRMDFSSFFESKILNYKIDSDSLSQILEN